MSAFLTSRGADFASPSANMRPSAPAAGHPESLVSAVFTPPPSVSIAAKQRQESVRALAAMVTAVRRLENLFLSDVAVSWVPSKGLELMQAHHRTGGVSMTNSINSSITSGATGRSPFGGHSGISVDGATAFPAALTSAYAALGAADAADLSEISHLFSQLRDRLYSMLAERVTVVEKRTLGTDTHRLQSAKERESSYQYGFHGGTMGGGCGVGCGIGCGGDHCHHHQPHISRDGSQRRRPAPAAPPVPTVHLVGGKPGGSADSNGAINMGLGLGGNSVSYDDQGNAIDHLQYGHHHSNSQQQQQQPVVVAGSSDRFSVNPAFDQTRSAQSADGHASTMGRYETESPVRRAVSNEPIIRVPSQSHSAVTAAVGQPNGGGGGKALSYVQYGYQQQQQQQQHMSGSHAMNNSTVSGSFAAAASPGTLHVHSRRTQSQLAASGGLDRSTSFAGSTHGAPPPSPATAGDHDNSRRTVMDSSYTAQQQQSRAGINPRGRSPPRSAIVMLKGQTRLRSGGAPETPQSSAAATQARKRLLASGGSVEPAGGARGVRTGGSANTSRSASGYQQPPDRSGSGGGAYGSGGFGPVGVGTDSGRGGALISRSPPRGRTHQQQLQEGFSYRVGAANPAPRTGSGADSADAFRPGDSSAGPSGNFMLTIPDEVPSLFGGAGANVPPPQFRDGPASSEDTHNYLDQQRQPQQFSESLTSPNHATLSGSAGNQSIYAPAAPPSSEAITASLRQAMHSVVDGTTDAPYARSGNDGGAVGGSFFPRRSPFPHASAAAVASDDASPVGVPLVAVSAGDNQQSFSTAPPPRPLTDTPLLDAGGAVGPHRSGSIGGSSSVGAGTAIDVGNSHVKLVVRPANDADDGHYQAPAAAVVSTTTTVQVAPPTSDKAVASMPPPPPSANAATARSGTTGSVARTVVAPTAATAVTAGSPVVGGLPTMVRDYHPSSTDALDAMDATVRPSHVDPTMGSRKNSTSPARRPQARVVGDTSSESGTPHDGFGRRAGGGNVDGDPHSGPFDATVNAPHPAGSRSRTSNPMTTTTTNAGPAIPPIGGAKGLTAAIRSGTEMGEVILLPPTRDELQWHRQALVHPLSLPSGLAVRGPSPFARAGPLLSNSNGTKTASAGDDAAGAVSVEGDNSRAARRYGSAARRGGSAAPVARLQALGAAVASRFLVVDVVGAGNLNGNGAGAASAFASAWVRNAAFPRGTARLLRTATAPRVANPVWGRGNGPTRIVVNTAEALATHQMEVQKAAAPASQAGNAAPAPQPPALSLVVSNDLYLPEELMYEGGVALNANSALSRDAICPCSGLARIPLTLRSERPVSQLRIPLELPGEKDPRQRVPTDGFVALRITQLAPAPAKILGQPMRPAPEGATGADAYVPAAWLVMNLRRVSALPAAMLARGVFSHVDIVASFRKGAQQQQPPAAEGESGSAADPKAAATAVANRGEVDDGRILARCFGVPPTLADAARLAAAGGDMDHDFSVGGVAAMRWPGAQGDVDSLEIRLRVYVMPRPGSSSADDEDKKSKKKDGSQNDEGKDQQQPRGPRPVCVATAVLPAASVLSQRCGTLLLYAVPEPGVVEQFEKESGINNNKGGFFSRFRSKEKAATPVAAEVDSVLVEVDLTPTVETGFGGAPTAGPANGASETGARTPSRALIPPVTFGAATASSLAVPLDAMSSVAVDQFFAATTAPLNPAAAGAQLAQRQRDFMKFQQKSETAHEKAVVSVIGVAAVRAALESPRRARSLSPGGGSRGGSVPRQSSTGGASDSQHNPHGASSSNVAAALPSSVATGVGATGANGRTATTFGTDSPVAVASASGRVVGAIGATLNSAPGSISMTSGIRAPALPAQQAPPPQQPQQEPNSNMRTTSPSRPPAPPSPPPPSAIRPGVTDSLAEASFNANMGGRSESRDPAQARMSTTATTGDGQSSLTGSSRAMSSAASAPVVIDRPRTAAAAAAPSTSVISSSGGMPPLSTRGSVVSAPPQPQPSQSTAGPAAVAGPPAAGGASATRRQIMERFRHKGSSDSDSD